MLRRSYLLILPIVTLNLAGCGGIVHASSNKAMGYSSRVDRILLSLSLANAFPREKTIVDSLSDRLGRQGVALQAVTVDPLELERGDAMRTAISSFRPSHIMELKTASVTTRGGIATAATLDCGLYDIAMRKNIWRSSIRILIGYYIDYDNIAEEIVKQLKAYDLLPVKLLPTP